MKDEKSERKEEVKCERRKSEMIEKKEGGLRPEKPKKKQSQIKNLR